MKKLFSATICTAMLIATALHATVRTVNNNSTSPGQYTTLQSAINAATAGDTILVSGSTTDYAAAGEITISKKIVLFGTGYNPIKDLPLVSTVSTIHLLAGSSGTVIVGFNISTQLYADQGAGINNILIKRNAINVTSGESPNLLVLNEQGDGWVIQENIFAGTIGINGNNILVKNNIFHDNPYGYFYNTSGNTNLIFSNNIVFWCRFAQGPPVLYNALVTNNIFYDQDGYDISYTGFNNVIASNNIVFNNPDANPFNIGANGNTGSGNKYNTDPKFTSLTLNYDGNGGTDVVSLASNLALLSTSPGHNAGTDGKDIGIYGGAGAQNPLTGNPGIPQTSTMNILNTVVAPGGTLNVAIKAKSSN